jgi:hypothetical protein
MRHDPACPDFGFDRIQTRVYALHKGYVENPPDTVPEVGNVMSESDQTG